MLLVFILMDAVHPSPGAGFCRWLDTLAFALSKIFRVMGLGSTWEYVGGDRDETVNWGTWRNREGEVHCEDRGGQEWKSPLSHDSGEQQMEKSTGQRHEIAHLTTKGLGAGIGVKC